MSPLDLPMEIIHFFVYREEVGAVMGAEVDEEEPDEADEAEVVEDEVADKDELVDQ